MFKLLRIGAVATVIAVMGVLSFGTSAFAQGPVTTPPLAGTGLRIGGPANSLVAVAAQKLNVTVAALVAELSQGKSIADVAKAKGVTAQTIIDAVVANRTAALKAAVDAKRITQAQMDAQLAVVKTNVTTRISTPWTAGAYAAGTGLGMRPRMSAGMGMRPRMGAGVGMQPGTAIQPGIGVGAGFVDANKDGICDNCGTTGQFLGRRGRWTR